MQKACYHKAHFSLCTFYSPTSFANKANRKQKYYWKWKVVFKIIDISYARECCATQCSFNNIIFFKTTAQMVLDIGGVYFYREVIMLPPLLVSLLIIMPFEMALNPLHSKFPKSFLSSKTSDCLLKEETVIQFLCFSILIKSLKRFYNWFIELFNQFNSRKFGFLQSPFH